MPLEASGLGLVVFTARPGLAARVIATLADWVGRAVSHYQPAYLLLARSAEQPTRSVLLAGVRESQALQAAAACPFSLEPVLAELRPLMAGRPEPYVHWPGGVAAGPAGGRRV